MKARNDLVNPNPLMEDSMITILKVISKHPWGYFCRIRDQDGTAKDVRFSPALGLVLDVLMARQEEPPEKDYDFIISKDSRSGDPIYTLHGFTPKKGGD